MNAIILAAGLGTRMRPLSRRRAKPVLPVLDEPLLRRTIRTLASLGISRVVYNAHVHIDQLERAVQGAEIPVFASHEPVLCGSAGGILKARAYLDGDDDFLVINADMCIDFDLGALTQRHRCTGALVTLLLREDTRKEAFGTIGHKEDGQVCRITRLFEREGEKGCGLFTGVQLMSPRVFDHIPGIEPSDLVPDVYIPLLEEGHLISAVHMDPKLRWWPIGSPRELLWANLAELDLRCRGPRAVLAHASARVEGRVTGPAWVGANVHVPSSADLGPRVIIGADTAIPNGYRASEMLFIPGATPPPARTHTGSPSGASTGAERRAIAFDQEIWRDD